MFFSLTFDTGGVKWVEKPPTFIRLLRNSPLTVFNHGYFWLIILYMVSGFVLPLKYFKSQQIHCITASMSRRYFRLTGPIVMTYLIVIAVIRSGRTLHGWPFAAGGNNRTLLQVVLDGLFGIWLG